LDRLRYSQGSSPCARINCWRWQDVAISDPCVVHSPLGEDWDGDGIGLDNDGDDLYEANDPDCVGVAVQESMWGAIKTLFR
jgi:hypothetical protein